MRISDIIKILVILFCVLLLLPAFIPQFPSESVFDLAVNNICSIGIALFASEFAVKRFETRHQNTSFLIDLIKKTDELCDEMRHLVLQHITATYSNDNAKALAEKQLIAMYIDYSRMLPEYTRAIKHRLNSCKTNMNAQECATHLVEYATMADSIMQSDNMDDSQVNWNTIETSLLYISYVQTEIPKLLSCLKY